MGVWFDITCPKCGKKYTTRAHQSEIDWIEFLESRGPELLAEHCPSHDGVMEQAEKEWKAGAEERERKEEWELWDPDNL